MEKLSTPGRIRALGAVLAELWRKAGERTAPRPESITSGLPLLDAMIGGFLPGELAVIGGRPFMGKTALLHHILRTAACIEKRRCLLFSPQFSSTHVAMAMLRAEACVTSWDYCQPLSAHPAIATLEEASARLSDAPLHVDDTPHLTLAALQERSRSLHAEKKLDLCALDDLQALRLHEDQPPQNATRDIREMCAGLKHVAEELGVPILVAAGMGRGPEERGDHAPWFSDLHGANAIQEIADTVLLLHRPEFYDAEERPGALSVEIAKHPRRRGGFMDLSLDQISWRISCISPTGER